MVIDAIFFPTPFIKKKNVTFKITIELRREDGVPLTWFLILVWRSRKGQHFNINIFSKQIDFSSHFDYKNTTIKVIERWILLEIFKNFILVLLQVQNIKYLVNFTFQPSLALILLCVVWRSMTSEIDCCKKNTGKSLKKLRCIIHK